MKKILTVALVAPLCGCVYDSGVESKHETPPAFHNEQGIPVPPGFKELKIPEPRPKPKKDLSII